MGSQTIDCATVIARAIADSGVRVLMGVVGIPIMKVASAAQTINLPFYSFRNEQAASYSASAVGYLSVNGINNQMMPAVCLSCAGPGVIHSLAGISNAWANCWPMIHIACTPKRPNNQNIQTGAFQEAPTIETVRPYVKSIIEIHEIENIPLYIKQAVELSISGRPGVVYIEIPNHLILQTIDTQRIKWATSNITKLVMDKPLTSPSNVKQAFNMLQSAKQPLVIVGKGAALAGCENELRALIDRLRIPFLPTSMGAGVINDSHLLNATHARSHVLANADVILLVGARLNWQLHFGDSPKFNPNVQFIQIDISAEELISTNKITIGLHGHAQSIVQQLCDLQQGTSQQVSSWVDDIHRISSKRVQTLESLGQSDSNPISYYTAYAAIRKHLTSNPLMIIEGGNTLKIARAMLPVETARSRVDIGTFATMGLGIGYAIAAHAVQGDEQGRRVVAIQGDSAFGFSAMEFETAVRYALPIVFIVFNNSGVFNGETASVNQSSTQSVNHAAIVTPVTALSPQSHYEMFATMFGHPAKGWFVEHTDQLKSALEEAFHWTQGPSLINIIIDAADPVVVED